MKLSGGLVQSRWMPLCFERARALSLRMLLEKTQTKANRCSRRRNVRLKTATVHRGMIALAVRQTRDSAAISGLCKSTRARRVSQKGSLAKSAAAAELRSTKTAVVNASSCLAWRSLCLHTQTLHNIYIPLTTSSRCLGSRDSLNVFASRFFYLLVHSCTFSVAGRHRTDRFVFLFVFVYAYFWVGGFTVINVRRVCSAHIHSLRAKGFSIEFPLEQCVFFLCRITNQLFMFVCYMYRQHI